MPNPAGSPSSRASRCERTRRWSGSPTRGTRSRHAQTSSADAFLDLTVKTSGTDMTLADRAPRRSRTSCGCAPPRRAASAPERRRRRAAGRGPSSTPSTTSASTAKPPPRSSRPCSATCSRSGRCVRVSSRSRGSAPTASGPRSIGADVGWSASSARSARGSPRSSMRSRSRCTARRRRGAATRSR